MSSYAETHLRWAIVPAVLYLCFVVPIARAQATPGPRKWNSSPINNGTQRTETMLRSTLSLHPSDISANRELAEILQRTGRTRAAIGYLRKVVETSSQSDPDAKDCAQLELAVALVEDGQNDEAVSVLRKAVQSNRSFERGYYELGTALAHKDDFPAAVAAYGQAVKLDPSDLEAQLATAKALITLLRYAEAEPFLVSAGQSDTLAFDVALLRGIVYRHTGRESLAISELRTAIRLRPEDAEINLQLGEALRAVGQIEISLPYFQRAATLRPTSAIFFRLTSLYRALGRRIEEKVAVEEMNRQRRAESAHNQVEALKSQAEEAISAGKLAEAETAYEAAIELEPRNADLLTAAAVVLSRLQKKVAERQLLNRALVAAPGNAAALSELGTIEAQEGRMTEATEHLTQALRKDPQLAQALNSLAVIRAQEGDTNAARSLLEQAIESDHSYHEALRNLGLVYASSNEPHRAEEFIRQSVILAPDDGVGWTALGQLYASQGRNSLAVEALQRAANSAPETAVAHLLLARSLMRTGDKSAARREVDLVLKRWPASDEAVRLKADLAH